MKSPDLFGRSRSSSSVPVPPLNWPMGREKLQAGPHRSGCLPSARFDARLCALPLRHLTLSSSPCSKQPIPRLLESTEPTSHVSSGPPTPALALPFVPVEPASRAEWLAGRGALPRCRRRSQPSMHPAATERPRRHSTADSFFRRSEFCLSAFAHFPFSATATLRPSAAMPRPFAISSRPPLARTTSATVARQRWCPSAV